MDAERRTSWLERVAPSVCQDDAVAFAVAFGSQVRGAPDSESDIDIAVKFDTGLTPHERFQKRCFLSGDLQRSGSPFVDIADIERLPVDVAHDAVNGAFLCGDEGAFGAFKSDIESSFAEQRTEIRRHQQRVIDRIASEGLGG